MRHVRVIPVPYHAGVANHRFGQGPLRRISAAARGAIIAALEAITGWSEGVQFTIRNPNDGIYPATADYVHAIEVSGAQRLLFVSGTMGLNSSGVAPGDLDEQLRLIWSNLRRILSEAGMTTANIARLTSYLRDASYAQANRDARNVALGDRRIPTTTIVVQTLDPSWLVEIEAIAVA